MRVPTILPFFECEWWMRFKSFLSVHFSAVESWLTRTWKLASIKMVSGQDCENLADRMHRLKGRGRKKDRVREKKKREGTRRIFHSDLLAKVPRRQTNGIVDRWVFGPWYRCLSQTNASRLGWAAFHLARSWVEMSASCNKNDFFLWGVCVGWVGRNGGSKEEHRNFLQ